MMLFACDVQKENLRLYFSPECGVLEHVSREVHPGYVLEDRVVQASCDCTPWETVLIIMSKKSYNYITYNNREPMLRTALYEITGLIHIHINHITYSAIVRDDICESFHKVYQIQETEITIDAPVSYTPLNNKDIVFEFLESR